MIEFLFWWFVTSVVVSLVLGKLIAYGTGD